QWTVIGADDVHAGYIQTHNLGGLGRQLAFVGTQFDHFCRATTMQVGAELSWHGLALHGGYYLVSHYKTANVGARSFLDELLHQKVGFQSAEGIDQALGSLVGFSQNHTIALG